MTGVVDEVRVRERAWMDATDRPRSFVVVVVCGRRSRGGVGWGTDRRAGGWIGRVATDDATGER